MDKISTHTRSFWPRWVAKLALVLLLSLIYGSDDQLPGGGDSAFGQTADGEDRRLRKELLEERYRNDAKRVIERFVPSPEFYIEVDVTAAEKTSENLPYLPYGLNTRLIQTLPLAKLSDHVTNVKINLYLSDRFDTPAQERLNQILFKALGMSTQRGDSLEFTPLTMPYEQPDTKWTTQISSLESDLRQMQSDARVLERERNDIRQQLTAVQIQLDAERQKANEKTVEKSEVAESGEEKAADQATAAPAGDEASTGKDAPNWPMIAGIILIGLIIIGAGFVMAGRAMGGAVGKVADALQSVGGSIESGAKAAAESAAASGVPSGLPAPPAPGASAGGAGGMSDAPAGLPPVPKGASADSHKIVIELNEELKSSVTRETEPVLIAHVSSLLTNVATREMAVASLEIFGRDIANELFGKLSMGDQQEILRFMRQGKYSRPKVDVLLDAGEMIKTKLLAGMLRQGNGDLDPQIATKLANISNARLVELVSRLHQEIIPRLLIYLDPSRIADICDGLQKLEPRSFAKLVESLTEIPEAFTKKALDTDLLPALEEALKQIEANDQTPYMRFYLDVLESAGSDLGEQIKEGIPKNRQDVRTFLEGNFITYSTFFRLAMDVKESVVNRLSNLEISNFLLALNEEEKEQVKQALDQKRWELIEDELVRYQDLNKRQLDSATRFAREQMVARIKEVKGQTPLTEILAATEDSGNLESAA